MTKPRMILPPYLYRGDADKSGIRYLKEKSHHGQFHTNLINGGVGRKIFTEPLIGLINEHILSKFEGTHFLSFTTSKLSAFRYGLNLTEATDEIVNMCCEEYFDDDKQWDFAILTINTSKLQIKSSAFPGVYECLYEPVLKEFSRYGPYRVFLIDTNTALKTADPVKYGTALEYSAFDKEWLVLPAMLKDYRVSVEYSAILDGGCFNHTQYYKIDKEQYGKHNTISYYP